MSPAGSQSVYHTSSKAVGLENLHPNSTDSPGGNSLALTPQRVTRDIENSKQLGVS